MNVRVCFFYLPASNVGAATAAASPTVFLSATSSVAGDAAASLSFSTVLATSESGVVGSVLSGAFDSITTLSAAFSLVAVSASGVVLAS